MSIEPGTLLGRYRIERLIGAGGMGEVYAGFDTQLGRSVALKILPEDEATDRGRLARFEREAKLASALNHPAIVTVFDAGEASVEDGSSVHFLTMELIDGSNLSTWSRAQHDRRKIVSVLAEIADGLARAHEAGIVHRDLKPANIVVTVSGHPKILDFGIAKLREAKVSDEDAQTDTAPAWALGTPAYMSPEQVCGGDVDARSDIFSFGCVMVDALLGAPPFRRANAVETMHAVLHDDPLELDGLPADLQRIARKCLRKDREERYQSARDVALDLRDSLGEREIPRLRKRAAVPVTAIAVLMITGATWWLSRMTRRADTAAPPAPSSAQPLMERLTNSGNVTEGAISPDGRYLVYATIDGTDQTLWVRQVATLATVQVIPPERVSYYQLQISPDGDYVYYCLAQTSNRSFADIMRMPLLGGERRKIVANVDGNFSVSPDSKRIAFVRFSAVERVHRLSVADVQNGAETEVMTRSFPEFIFDMTWMPDGTHIAVELVSRGGSKAASRLVTVDVVSRRVAPIAGPTSDLYGPIASAPDGSGLALTVFDGRQFPQIWFLSPNGQAKKITSDLAYYGDRTIDHFTSLSLTRDSRSLVANREEISSNVWVTNGDGGEAHAVSRGVGNLIGVVRWMPDGRILHVRSAPDPTPYTIDVNGGDPRRFGRDLNFSQVAIAPDGRRIAYIRGYLPSGELWTAAIDGEDPKLLTRIGTASGPEWSADGRSIYFVALGREQAIWRVRSDGGEAPVRITSRPANTPVPSPDGRWLLCNLRSSDPHPARLWPIALLRADGSGKPRYFSAPTSSTPRWFPDSRVFAFAAGDARAKNIWTQDIAGGPPRQLTHFDSGAIETFDISRDGRRIAITRSVRVSDEVLIRNFR